MVTLAGMILHRKAKMVKIYRTRVVSVQTTSRNKILDGAKSDKNISEIKWYENQ
jgi:hypothetical protein